MSSLSRHPGRVAASVFWVLLALATALHADPSSHPIEYRIGPGDVLAIEVFGESDLSPRVRVSESGTIPYPFLGDLPVRGLTTDDLARTILEGLKGPYLIDPQVSVSIAEYRPFYVNGQVRKPGGFPFEPGMTVRKAITLAGGLTERASTRKIYLQREGSADGNDPVAVSLDDIVRPGDIITIEESFF